MAVRRPINLMSVSSAQTRAVVTSNSFKQQLKTTMLTLL